jgi:hypothetical protein
MLRFMLFQLLWGRAKKSGRLFKSSVYPAPGAVHPDRRHHHRWKKLQYVF